MSRKFHTGSGAFDLPLPKKGVRLELLRRRRDIPGTLNISSGN
jgi:hypothetical protein